MRAFEAWRVGRKGLDDGLVLFVFRDDRTVRIEVGYGLEGEVPDAVAHRIIDEQIAPRLRAGDPDGAVSSGVDAIVSAIEGPAAPPATGPSPSNAQRQRGDFGIWIVFGILTLLFLILLATNPSMALALLFTMRSGRHGWGGGSMGGFGGGGGRSGGGGASGSW